MTTTVGDLMSTALITGYPEDLVDESLFEMKLASIRHLPVISRNGKLEGVVSDRDVLLALGSNTQARNIYLKDIMVRQVETIDENADASIAAKIMVNRKIGCLPVTGDEGQLVGVVTETDFLRLVQELLFDENSKGDQENNERW